MGLWGRPGQCWAADGTLRLVSGIGMSGGLSGLSVFAGWLWGRTENAVPSPVSKVDYGVKTGFEVY